MALLAGAMCGVRNDSCFGKHKYARTSHGMASESLSRGVDLFFAQEFCFFKQEHGPPRGSKEAKTDVLLATVLGPLRGGRQRQQQRRRWMEDGRWGGVGGGCGGGEMRIVNSVSMIILCWSSELNEPLPDQIGRLPGSSRTVWRSVLLTRREFRLPFRKPREPGSRRHD